jgi:hypothetical protein
MDIKVTDQQIEAVARAICTTCYENPDHVGDARGNQWRWQDYVIPARAAIAAMKPAAELCGEPIYQFRLRNTSVFCGRWGFWNECEKDYQDKLKAAPESDGWEYEFRTLYLAPQPAQVSEGVHPSVAAIALAMQYKLNKNRNKDGAGWVRDSSGARNGWKGCSVEFLIGKLHEEVGELIEAITLQHGLEAIRNEAADVGNLAMMLADVCGALAAAPQPEGDQK